MMTNEEVWDKFADLIISNEHKMIADMFQSCSNLAWAFTKVEYSGKYSALFWKLIERTYRAEIENLRLNQFIPAYHSSTVLASISMAL